MNNWLKLFSSKVERSKLTISEIIFSNEFCPGNSHFFFKDLNFEIQVASFDQQFSQIYLQNG